MGVLPLYPSGYDPLTCCVENSGKLTVLSKMLEYLHTNTREKIVVVSNYTQVCMSCVHIYGDCSVEKISQPLYHIVAPFGYSCSILVSYLRCINSFQATLCDMQKCICMTICL